MFPQVNKNLVDVFESPPHVLSKSRENYTNKYYMNYFYTLHSNRVTHYNEFLA